MNDIPNTIALRAFLIQAIALLLNDPTHKEQVTRQLEQIQRYILSIEGAFTFVSVVYGGTVRLLLDTEVQSDAAALSSILAGLTGDKPVWFRFALKYNFSELLPEAYEVTLKQIKEAVNLLHQSRFDQAGNGITVAREEFERYWNSLSDFLTHQKPIETLPELLVSTIANAIISIPYEEGKFFDPTEHYSSIYPVPTQVATQAELDYASRLIQQSHGEEILLLDVTMLKDGYILNLH